MTKDRISAASEKEDNFISAVVYLHNNADNIGSFMELLHECLNNNFKHYEIICVDDGCSDDSIKLLREVASALNLPVLSILHMSFYQGMEIAMSAGVDLAIGDFVFEFDNVSFDYPATVIMDSYRRSLAGFDIVSVVPKGSISLSSKLFYKVFNRFSSVPIKLESETFRVVSRRAINRVRSMGSVIPYRKAMYANCGLRQDSLRYDATSAYILPQSPKMRGFRKNLALEAMIFHTDFAYRIVFAITIAMLFLTLLAFLYTVAVFSIAYTIPGWTTTMLLISFCFCALFGIMAFVIKYLSILVDLVFRRKRYVIESLEKIAGYSGSLSGSFEDTTND